MKVLAKIALATSVFLLSVAESQASPSPTQTGAAIKQLVVSDVMTEQQMSKAPTIDRILISNTTAWTVWTHGEIVGESLLRYNGYAWKILASGSKGPIDSTLMEGMGIPHSDANAIGQLQSVQCTKVKNYTTASRVKVICYDLGY